MRSALRSGHHCHAGDIATIRDGKASDYEVFVEGWLQGELTWGRPVDVLVMPDRALPMIAPGYRASYASAKRRPSAKDPIDQASYLNESLTRAR